MNIWLRRMHGMEQVQSDWTREEDWGIGGWGGRATREEPANHARNEDGWNKITRG